MAPLALTALVAVDQNWDIGSDGQLLTRLSPDMKRFRALTLGKTVVMGRKTFESLPGARALPGRRNIVLSRSAGAVFDGAEVCADADELPDMLVPGEEVFVIGGAQVYALLLPRCQTALVTKIEADLSPADCSFPDLDAHPDWRMCERSPLQEWEGLRFRYVTYQNIADKFL